jgi:phytoene dehydrogenase-like protein
VTDPVDAVVVGAGPNGLAAAVTLARAGRSVRVVEARPTVGGGASSRELTLPGFVHDPCAAIHPLGAASPFFRSLPLDEHGLRWDHFDVLVAHPLDDGRVGAAFQDLARTVEGLGRDGPSYRRLVGAIAGRWDRVAAAALGPLTRVPRHPLALAGLGVRSLPPATVMARALFRTEEARALFAGNAAHSILPLSHPLTSSAAVLLMAAGHAAGWPAARGGSQAISEALASLLRHHGGEVETGRPVGSSADLPPSRAVLFDLAPSAVADICGDQLPARTAARYRRYRHGPGVFKVDYALSGPVPWTADVARRAGTVHVGGTMAEVAAAEARVAAGGHPERPFVLVAQQSLADPTRAPAGQHTLWAYCHVPSRSTVDMTERIEAQIDRFAPGWRDLVLARHTADCAAIEAENPNDVGGDIAGGALDGLQFLFRPGPVLHPYRTGNDRLFLCSASTPPGGGVHGMCGHQAALDALRTVLR